MEGDLTVVAHERLVMREHGGLVPSIRPDDLVAEQSVEGDDRAVFESHPCVVDSGHVATVARTLCNIVASSVVGAVHVPAVLATVDIEDER